MQMKGQTEVNNSVKFAQELCTCTRSVFWSTFYFKKGLHFRADLFHFTWAQRYSHVLKTLRNMFSLVFCLHSSISSIVSFLLSFSLPVSLFFLYLSPPAFLHFIFLLLMLLLILRLTLSATTFLLVSVSLENLCCYAPFVGCNRSIHWLRFKSVRTYQRERHCTEQKDRHR